MGLYNWTKTATQHNKENIFITDNNDIVIGFIDSFSQLWETTVMLTNK
jgi:phosphatidylserine/phosphatidylglycerophosphate/cardiolipin synthase-like enzyme